MGSHNFGEKAESLPDGYKQATGEKACANCGAYKDGLCEMYYMPVEADYVCDDWTETYRAES